MIPEGKRRYQVTLTEANAIGLKASIAEMGAHPSEFSAIIDGMIAEVLPVMRELADMKRAGAMLTIGDLFDIQRKTAKAHLRQMEMELKGRA